VGSWNLTSSLVCFALFSLSSIAQPPSPADQTVDVSRWKTFTNRAGWAIKHPDSWRVGSCAHCSDPTDPYGFVTFENPSTKELIMIEHLIDKPADQTLEQWLNNVKVTSVLNSFVREEWISLNGTRALKVFNRNVDSTESENIYIVHRSKTFAIRADPAYRIFPRMLSTFRFTGK